MQQVEPSGIRRLDGVPNVLRGATSAVFSPDGNRIATKVFINSDGTIEVTDLDSGHKERHTAVPWTTPAARASDGSAQPPETPWQIHDGRGLGASIPTDGTLALWDTMRTQQIGKIDIGVEPDRDGLSLMPDISKDLLTRQVSVPTRR